MASTLTIHKVDNPQHYKAFFDFPWKVYKDDPHWTPPLVSMRRDLIDKQKNPAWQYMEGDYFIAERNGEVVGTIAAFINHRHNEFQKEHVGWFGAFEVLEDEEAAHQLLDTACQWVRDKGYNMIRGPQTFTTHEDVGLLIEGYEKPVLLMPYHHPYYRQYIESYGFKTSMDHYSYYFDWDMLQEKGFESRLERIVQRILTRSDVTLRPIDRKNLRRDFELFKELYNEVWVENWGFVPLTEAELDALIEGLGMIFDPDLACFAEVNGELVGFLLVVPDFNQVLHAAYPRPGIPEPLKLLQVLWHWKIRPKITNARTPLMGVKSEYRNRGIDLVMYYTVMLNLREKGYKSVDCGWILEKNQDMNGVLHGIGMEIHRIHRLYEYST